VKSSNSILIINPWSGNIGPNTFLKNLVFGLISKNINVTILYPHKDFFSIQLSNLGCEIRYVPFLKLEHSNYSVLKFYKYILKEIFLFIYFFKIKSNTFQNILINSELFSFSLFGLSKKPNSFIVVHALSFANSSLKTSVIFNIQNLIVNKYIAVSKVVKSNLLIKGVKKYIILCYNGVDLKLFKPKIKNNKQINLISIIHPVPIKGAHHLISTLSILKKKGVKFNCKILGWGNNPVDKKYKLKIKNLVKTKKLEDSIIFMPSSEVRTELVDSDILIHPSKLESFGFVIAEALAMRIPVVAFRVGAVPEIVDDNFSGFLLEPFNTIEMANAVIKLIKSKKMRLEFGLNGRNKIEALFNSKINIENLINKHF
jgi:glycosyltransferase involved in cell wall biosynthesis